MALLLAGCSYVPDELNPVEWVSAVSDWIEGGDEETTPEAAQRLASERARPVPGSEEPFPSLGTVPDQRPEVSSYEERQATAESLIADRANAHYTDEPEPAVAPTPSPSAPGRPATVPARDTRGLYAPPPAMVAQSSSGLEPARATGGYPIQPPPVVQVPGWSAVAQEYNAMFLASGGAGNLGRAGANAPAMTLPPTAPAPPTAVPSYVAATPSYAPAVGGAAAQMGSLEDFQPAAVNRALHAAVIYFAHGSARLSRQDREVLRQVAAAQNEYGGNVRVVGHASSRTRTSDVLAHKIANYEISVDRARVVAQELVRLGVSPQKLLVGAMADTEPQYSEATPMGEAANRRADIYLDLTRPQS